MNISTHCGGFCQTNGYLIETGNGAVAIDAPEGMFHFCKQKGVKPTGLLLTHQHFDHVEDAALFHENGIPIYASEPFSRDLQLEGLLRTWGLTIQIEEFPVEHILATENSPLPLADLEFEFFRQGTRPQITLFPLQPGTSYHRPDCEPEECPGR